MFWFIYLIKFVTYKSILITIFFSNKAYKNNIKNIYILYKMVTSKPNLI